MSSVIAREEPRSRSTAVTVSWPGRETLVALGTAALLVCLIGLLLKIEVGLHRPRLIVVTLTMTALWTLTLYWSRSVARSRQLSTPVAALVGTLTGLAGVSLANFWIFHTVVPQTDLLLIAGAVFVVTWGWHALSASRVASPTRVAIVGTDDELGDTILELQRENRRRLELAGILGEPFSGNGLAADPAANGHGELVAAIREMRPALIACANGRERVVEALLDAGIASIPVIDMIELQERALRRVATTTVSPAWFAGVFEVNQRYSSRAKRVFDLTVGIAAIVVSAPLFAVIPLAIRCSSKGPAFYRQTRTGEGGRLFQIVKFRTMVADAENGAAIWASESDPRVTAIGRFLRKTRLDELPQLWNVLRGEMSIVGPRPERPEFMGVLSDHLPCWNRRHLVKPGITGWAQVQYSYTADVSGAATKLAYDLYYLKHRSLGLDLLILMKTFGVVFLRSGAR